MGTGTELALDQADIDANMQYQCGFTDTAASYGTVNVDSDLEASHTRGTTDASDTLALEDGVLTVAGSNAAHYHLEGNELKVTAGAGGTIVSTAIFTKRETARVITFEYNHNGLRTKKTVKEGGVTTTYEYTLHGKLITHMTKRVEENGDTSEEQLHFDYDAQSRPAFVEYNGTKYCYVHNFQGDIVAIVDAAGNPVVEYKYDAWGKQIGTGFGTGIGTASPFRYRGYMWDEEYGLYYLRRRYYDATYGRFISRDSILMKNVLLQSNLWNYCSNKPIIYKDPSGMKFYLIGDEQGYEVLNHWLEGSGEELICDSDAWGEYMREQETLNAIIEQEIYNAYKECLNSIDGTYSRKNIRSVELDRNSMLPYGNGYLHGTQYFQMSVKASLKKQRNEFNFRVDCEWKDTINANYNYTSDKIWEKIAKLIFSPKDYSIKVRWTCDTSNFWDRFMNFFKKKQK